MIVSNLDELREIYGKPSGRAKDKVLKSLEKHSIHFIENAPFLTLSTMNQTGEMDCSPRGGNPGFVKVLNETCIVIPDAKGNNRVDSLSNIVETGNIGLLFIIPGLDETLRVNGHAYISTNEEHINLFSSEEKTIKACIVITIEEVFLHCAKAFMRSKLWKLEAQIKRSYFPSMGQMLKDQIGSTEEPEDTEAMIKRYQKDL
ncbi:MAG: PPOX class probable FMN-dependent enzyme [Flavobacteriaceae bacterium]|jgi:PPOX class probable FMN-dependent enzyme|uniref:pyridoxamine 5'-phosphate oxidase family protein n=1 Tax=Candidatus Marifrigoribacter sp. Uisw_064 TaxID=3230970 RepID=UPI003AE29061